MKFAFFFFFVLSLYSIQAQDKVICVHPIVGDTIDLQEKKVYLLFSFIKDDDFSKAVVKQNKDQYLLYTAKDNKIRKIQKDVINECHRNIEKLVAYFALQSKKDTLKLIREIHEVDESLPVHTSFLSAEQLKRISKKANRYQELKLDGQDQGLWGKDLDKYISESFSIPFVISDQHSVKNHP